MVDSVCSAVRTDSLYKADYVWSLNSRDESVYSAVRTDSLYKADYVWSLNSRGGKSVQSPTGSRGVRISGSNAGYTMFRDSVKSTG